MHGDAAFAGQGVVAETLELSQLRGYRTGGTVHVVVNNQVGFTTSPAAARSSVYATDVARAVQAPIFHVNGDDPEAVVRVAQEAFEFRRAFKKDVVIDLVCYRRRGHNEADDPSLTQPLMYNVIDNKRSARKLYTEALIGRGDITVEEAEGALRNYQEQLEKVFRETREAAEAADETVEPASEVEQRGEVTLAPQTPERDVVTAVSRDSVDRVVQTQLQLPDGFTVHPRLAPQLQRRAQMVEDDTIDWAMGETLAIGSLLSDGISVRLAGQDSRRGTFGQRHMVIIDRKTGWAYKPLKRCYEKGAKLYVYDSPLVGVRRHGLRVRLQRRAAGGAGDVGGPVRRLRQRGPDDHRRVPRARRAEVGSAVRPRAAAAARPRRPGARPLVGPHRAVPAALRAGQHDDREPDDARELLPPAAVAGAVAGPTSARGLHSQVDAAAEGVGLAHRGLHLGALQPGLPRHRRDA